MSKSFILLFFVFISLASSAQSFENVASDSLKVVDLKYREDQFYFGLTHSLMQDKPTSFSQRSVSLGINAGFLRDFPINKARNWAIAPGVGYSYLNLHHNLAVFDSGTGNYTYGVLDNYERNIHSLHYIDFPIELRWRSSTPYSHKFWRVYAGFKFSYLLYDKATSDNAFGNAVIKNNPDVNKWAYGAYLSAGFNTWNVYAYYGLNTVYKSEVIESNSNKLRAFNLGLMFYIL